MLVCRTQMNLHVRPCQEYCGPRLRIYTAHDSSLIPLLCALNVYDNVWPPYSSTAIIEVGQAQSGDSYARFIFNDRVTSPFPGKLEATEGGWVPLSQFSALLRSSGFESKTAYQHACRLGSEDVPTPAPRVDALSDTLEGDSRPRTSKL